MKPALKLMSATCLAALLAVQPGLAEQDMLCSSDGLKLTESDASRLDNMFISRTRGLGAAMAADSREDRAAVSKLFESGLAPADPELLAGEYQCRTLKMGGNLPLVVYNWFQCRISADDGAGTFSIEKITGSQNFSGTLSPQGGIYAYRGASTYGYEDAPLAYGDDEERNQVGCLSAVTKGNKHFMLELPFPVFESFHDVIELKPVR